jgi:hypothetical protein
MSKEYEEFCNKLKSMKYVDEIDTNTFAGKAIIACLHKLKGKLSRNGLDILTNLDMIEYLMLMNKFQSLGITITAENRDDKYIEIIEKDDEKLLNDLERLITLAERIDRLIFQKKEYENIVEKVSMSEPNNKQEIIDVVKDYLKN